MVIRVAHVVHGLGAGGAERRLLALLAALDGARFESRIVCLDSLGVLADDARALGVEPVLLQRSGRADLSLVVRLSHWFRTERIDVVHGWLSLPSVFARLAGVGARVPVKIAAEGGVRSTTDERRLRIYGLLDRLLAPATDAYIANSHAVGAALTSRGVDKRKVIVIPNGVGDPEPLSDEARVSRRRELGAEEDDELVGMVARLDDRFKDHSTFLRSVAALRAQGRPVRGAIVGDGPARGAILDSIRALGLSDAVVVTGFRRDAARLVAAFDVSVLLSYSEGFSNVILETMAAGVPLVATDIAPNREALRDGVEGLLVPVGDETATTAAIRRMLGDPRFSASSGAAARLRAASEYSLAAQATRTADLYEQLLARRG
jgi:glycosyltransferase involved in cell wall biosynthesis